MAEPSLKAPGDPPKTSSGAPLGSHLPSSVAVPPSVPAPQQDILFMP